MCDENNDHQHVEACQNGSREAFAVLVHRYRLRVYHVALTFTHNPDHAMDITQETFLRAYQAIRSLQSGKAFYPWLHRITRNTAISWLRKRKHTSQEMNDEQLPPWTVTPQMLMVQNEQIEQLRCAMNQLEEDDRHLLHLRHFESLNYKQIADVLDTPISTVGTRLYRARSRLKALMEETTP